MMVQNLNHIAFSNSPWFRWKRHLLFWLAVYLYQIVRIGLMMPPVENFYTLWLLMKYSFVRGVVPNVLFTYSIVYFLIPKYFNHGRYAWFVLGLLISIILLQTYGVILDILRMNAKVQFAGGSGWNQNNMENQAFLYNAIRPGFIRLFGNPPLIFGLFLSIKILKNWHLEQLKTETLSRENTHAELQLLKAQVHPHFLFNTLNNIYSFTLAKSPLAGNLVQKLSDMLNYMIHECEKPLVPLDQEIKLIRDYIGLESVRYGNRLRMELEIDGNSENKLIAPLLMIPFVENCFKHGASVMRGNQWIRLCIQVNEDQLEFHLSNSKPPDTRESGIKGIGLINVRKRLDLIYPGKHLLEIHTTDKSYLVHLQLELQNVLMPEPLFEGSPKLQLA